MIEIQWFKASKSTSGIHDSNYGQLFILWDKLFGTFKILHLAVYGIGFYNFLNHESKHYSFYF